MIKAYIVVVSMSNGYQMTGVCSSVREIENQVNEGLSKNFKDITFDDCKLLSVSQAEFSYKTKDGYFSQKSCIGPQRARKRRKRL